MVVITKEQSESEVSKWLDYKKVSEKRKESYKEHIDNLAEAISEGSLELDDKMRFKHKLKFPLEGEMPVADLEYSPRIMVKEVHNRLRSVKSDDPDGRICAYVSALTKKPMEIIRNLDSEDYKICESIAIFFI